MNGESFDIWGWFIEEQGNGSLWIICWGEFGSQEIRYFWM